MVIVDYQEIINILAEYLRYSIPIGLIFGITEKLVRLFFSLAFGKDKVSL